MRSPLSEWNIRGLLFIFMPQIENNLQLPSVVKLLKQLLSNALSSNNIKGSTEDKHI